MIGIAVGICEACWCTMRTDRDAVVELVAMVVPRPGDESSRKTARFSVQLTRRSPLDHDRDLGRRDAHAEGVEKIRSQLSRTRSHPVISSPG